MERRTQAHVLQDLWATPKGRCCNLLSRQKQPFLGEEAVLWRLLGELGSLKRIGHTLGVG